MKVAIIGAGIIGLYLTWKLSEEGHNVTVFEKKDKIGKEVCSGLFSERILEFIPESQKLIQNKINYCLIHFPKKTLKINFSKNFLVMSHFELDNLVANSAKKSGAKIVLNYRVDKEKLTKLIENFERIIGTDGALSEVRRYLNLSKPNYYLGIQNYITLYSSNEGEQDWVETWPRKSGFVWKIPKGKEIEYGIIERPEKAKIIFEEFLKKNNLPSENLKSALIPQGLIIPKDFKITLCGDAVGLTKPWSGGGIIWGLTAADLLLKNFPDFLKYKKQIEKFFSTKILFSKAITRLVYFLGFKASWLLPKEFKIESDFLI